MRSNLSDADNIFGRTPEYGDFDEEYNAQRCADIICKFILLIENGRYAPNIRQERPGG